MLEINQSLPCKKGFYESRKGSAIKYIVLHYTANVKDTAKNNAKYFNAQNIRQASAHYFVDETSIYQSVQDNMAAWAVGGKAQSSHHPFLNKCTNYNSISIEMCTSGNSEVSETTENNAIELTKYLMKKYNVDTNHVVRHYDVNGKACPSVSFRTGNRWNNFIAKLGGSVQEATNTGTAPAPQPTPSTTNKNVDVIYQVKTQKHGWLPPVTNDNDYAGWQNSPIVGVAIRVSDGSIKYRVHIKGGGWLPYVTGCNINDSKNGWAGNGRVIDAIEIYYNTPSNIRPYKKARYKANNYSYQYDNEKGNRQDGYAGAFGVAMTKLFIRIV